MLRLLIDQDLDQDILRGLQLRLPDLDVVTAHQAGLSEAPDPALLAWADEQDRIIVTHDRRTMPRHVTDRITAGERVAGVFIVPRRLPLSQVLDDLEVMVACSEHHEWEDLVRFLPL